VNKLVSAGNCCGAVVSGGVLSRLTPALLDPVAGVRQRALLGRGGAEDLEQGVESVGGRQCTGGEVLCDRGSRPPGDPRELAIGQLVVHAGARVPAAQRTQQLGQALKRRHLRRQPDQCVRRLR
jgi:hypothetical protein